MSGGPGPAARAVPWFLALVLFTAVVQSTYNAVRVLISYRVIELGGGAGVLGLVAASYSLMPLLLAIAIGRIVDRGYTTALMWAGTAFTVLPIVLAAWTPGLGWLLVANAALGLGQILVTVTAQSLIPLHFAPADLNGRFGTLTIGVSVGQLVGLPLVGFIAGSGEGDPRTQAAMWTMAAVGVLAVPLLVLVGLRPRIGGHRSRAEVKETRQSPLEILRVRGMKTAIFASMSTLAAVDIMTAYLPLVGERHGIAVQFITLIITVRTVVSILARMGMNPVARRFGNLPVLSVSSTLAGLSVLLIPAATAFLTEVPLFWVLLVLLSLGGIGFGLTQPLTMTWVSTLSDPDNRGAVLSVRLAGNRLSQVALPATASLVAGFAPLGTVFVLIGVMLLSAGASTAVFRRRAVAAGRADR
ncbi:MFS transporter [Brevibacterium litoralis]|uniref:MFS transporter n=1 Tax=Brevibacterium litoralis TaxID=3138935 RepID=UPI0032F09111